MWSLGCVLAELRTGAPLFPGEAREGGGLRVGTLSFAGLGTLAGVLAGRNGAAGRHGALLAGHRRPRAPHPSAMPGEDEKEQLACIMEVLGKPPSDIALYSARAPIFFDPGEGGG